MFLTRKPSAFSWLYGLCVLLSTQRTRADDLEDVKRLIGNPYMPIVHKVTMTPKKDNVPPCRDDRWTFGGSEGVVIHYNRYLNRPPDYQGQYASLASGDMGIGFDGWAFANWYRGSVIRVLINGADVIAAKPASQIKIQEGDYGRLRLAWEDEDGKLVLNFTVPDDGHAIYACIEIIPTKLSIQSIELQLGCFPGGYEPAYNLPSERWVAMASGQWRVPKGFKPSENNPFPKASLAKGDEWIFYADALKDEGSLGLLLLREESPSGTIQLTNYGQRTELKYPANTRQIHLAFYAFDTATQYSHDWLVSSVSRLRNELIEAYRQCAEDGRSKP